MSKPKIKFRKAQLHEVPQLADLIARSSRGLAQNDYSNEQIEAAIGTVWGVDEELIRDQTYFVAETEQGDIVGCGGWSKRAKLFGASENDESSTLLDPKKDSARIRAFFVDPNFTRLGIGREIIRLCEHEALDAGFSKMELMATLPGHRLYKSCGYLGDDIVEAGSTAENTHSCVPMYKYIKR